MSEIIVENDGPVRLIRLNRPDKLNAINLEMLGALDVAIAAANADDRIRALILCGDGRAFCAGDDVNQQSAIAAAGETALRSQLGLLQGISRHIVLGPKPVVAAVHGWAIGAGLSWVLNADYVVCRQGARAMFPEVRFGTFVTGGASWLLAQIAGPRRAADMLLRGVEIGAQEMLEAGIASTIVEDDPLAVARAAALDFASQPDAASRWMTTALGAAQAAAFETALNREVEACVATTLDPQTLERMRQAMEGRNH